MSQCFELHSYQISGLSIFGHTISLSQCPSKARAEESTFLSTVQQVSKSLLWYVKSIVHSDLLYNQRVVLLSCKLNNFGECVPQMMCHEKIVKSLYFLWNLKNFKTVLVSYQICDKAKSNSCRLIVE